MARASEFPLLLPQVREDLRDYRIPGSHLHRPGALTTLRLPSGRLVTPPSPGGEALGAAPGVPSTHIWPYRIAASVNTRSVIVSSGYPGPGLIVAWFATIGDTGSTTGGLSLFHATENGGAKDNSADLSAPSGSQVLDPIGRSSPDTDVDEIPGHIPYTSTFATVLWPVLPLRFFVPTPGLFFLKLSIRGGAAAASSKGVITLYAGVDPTDLPF